MGFSGLKKVSLPLNSVPNDPPFLSFLIYSSFSVTCFPGQPNSSGIQKGWLGPINHGQEPCKYVAWFLMGFSVLTSNSPALWPKATGRDFLCAQRFRSPCMEIAKMGYREEGRARWHGQRQWILGAKHSTISLIHAPVDKRCDVFFLSDGNASWCCWGLNGNASCWLS